MTIKNSIDDGMRKVALAVLSLYQATLSPDKGLLRFRLHGRICAHEPHCSEYAKQCFQKYSFFTALHYTMERVSSCVPRYEKQYDPSSYRVVFFSSAPIGVPFLQQIEQDPRFDLVGVVTMPDAPVGRGMNVQENVIKQEARKILPKMGYKKIVLLHGKDATPEDKRYPRFIEEVKKRNMLIIAPYLPQRHNPVLEEWLDVIDSVSIDDETCVIAHSRGGVALLRWIETRKKKVGKIILVATNDSVYPESKNGFFQKTDYAYEIIKSNCSDITVLHAQDDETVPFSHGQKIATGLSAKTRFPIGFGHFGRSLGGKFEEILDFIFVEHIATPRSLRVDSKKYGADAQTFQQRVHDLQPDLFVVIAYGHIMPQWVLDIPYFGSINVHGSLLPEYRGASPLQSIFLDGKEKTGITVMYMDAGVDTGDIIATLETPVPLSRTVRDLIEWIKIQGPHFLTATLRDWCKGTIAKRAQNDEGSSVCRKFEKEDGLIDPFHESMLEIRQKRQAFALWPKLYFFYGEKRITVDYLSIKNNTTRDDLEGICMTKSGKTYSLHPAIEDIRLVPEGKKSLSRDEFLHGYGGKNL